MKKFFVILVLLLFTSIAFADGGRFGDNWCNEGGPLEGQCTIPGDEALTNYMWELGWYLAAVDNHDIAPGDVPDRFIKTTEPVDADGDGEPDDPANCESIVLPDAADGAVTVVGELITEGITYESVPIPVGVYEANAAGETYDPYTVGRKHRVKITSKDADGNVIGEKKYTFKCSGNPDAIDPSDFLP